MSRQIPRKIPLLSHTACLMGTQPKLGRVVKIKTGANTYSPLQKIPLPSPFDKGGKRGI